MAMAMADEDRIMNFLRFGADPGGIQGLDSSVTAPFLPALALAATDAPSLLSPLLSSLAWHSQTPRAFSYASLDYFEICRKCQNYASTSGLAPGVSEEEEWEWHKEEGGAAGPDERDAFQQGEEIERVKIAVLSLQQRATMFDVRWSQRDIAGKGKVSQQEDSEGSIWSNEACLSELLCLLPIVTSRCPTLLTPELLIKGLLTARYGCLLLVITLANNPSLVDRGAYLLAQIIRIYSDASETRPNSPQIQDLASSATNTMTVETGLHRQLSGPITTHTPLPHTEHAEAAVLTLTRLCQVAPSLALICREALVNTSSLAELALHITVEIMHDEVEFLSRLIFSREATSQWILYHFGANLKSGNSLPLPPLGEARAPRGGTTNSGRAKDKEGSAARVRDALLADARHTWREAGWGGRLHAHLRLYCVLVRAGDLNPRHEEVDFWLKSLGNSTCDSGFVSVRTLQLGMAFFCIVPGLLGPSTKTLFHAAMGCLLKAAAVSSSTACTPANVELAVWLGVQLLLRRFPDIAMFVREALGMNVTVHIGLMRDASEAASSAGIISDASLIAYNVANLRPSSPIVDDKWRAVGCISYHLCRDLVEDRKQPDLALKCIEQLMTTGTFNFSRYAVDVSNTIMHCLSLAQEPIHPVLPQLVHSFADMSATVSRPRGAIQPFKMRPFPREWLVAAISPACLLLSSIGGSTVAKSSRRPITQHQVKKIAKTIRHQKQQSEDINGNRKEIKSSGDSLATAALVVYYILCREQIFRSMGVDSATHGWDSSNVESGKQESNWTELLACLPLESLLNHMEEHWLSYKNLLPQLYAIVSVILPERCLAPTLIEDRKVVGAPFVPLIAGVAATADLEWLGPDPPLGVDLLELHANDLMSMNPESENLSGPLEGGSESKHMDSGVDFLSLETITTAMKDALKEPLPALRVLQAMGRASTCCRRNNPIDGGDAQLGLGAKLWKNEACVIKELVPLLLKPRCSRCLQETFCLWWQSLPSSGKEYLTPLLVITLRDPINSSNGTATCSNRSGFYFPKPKDTQLVSLSSSGLQLDPLGLLGCSAAVFRTPPLLGVVLELLIEILTANRRICQAAAIEGGRDGMKKEEVTSALAAQDSAVCQILLEGCLPSPVLGDDEEPGPLLEARKLICATITTLIHSSPILLKLLHFQGYETSLVPMMVEGVPTMVQCLDFIGELLQQPLQERQIFAVVLTAHIVCVHPLLPQSLSVAQQVVAHVSQVRSKVAGSASFLLEVLSPLALCAGAFPHLAPQVVAILQSCAQAGGPLTVSGPARDPALQASATAAFKQLIHLKLLHGQPPPLSSLSAVSKS